jgi:hypothetical protein
MLIEHQAITSASGGGILFDFVYGMPIFRSCPLEFFVSSAQGM